MWEGGIRKNPPNHCALKLGGERSQKIPIVIFSGTYNDRYVVLFI